MNTNLRVESIEIPVTPDIRVSGVVCTPEWWPSGQRVGIVLAHDTDGSIEQEKLIELRNALAELGNLTLSFNFPYVQAGKKRPDPAPTLERTYRAAAASLSRDSENAPARLVIGGYGLGARVATSVVSQGLKVDGILCLGFPLHPSGKPNQQRAGALFRIICPMLFVQGARDTHCRVDRLQTLLRRIGAPTDLCVIEDCGQGLDPIKRAEHTPEQVRELTLAAITSFVEKVVGTA